MLPHQVDPWLHPPDITNRPLFLRIIHSIIDPHWRLLNCIIKSPFLDDEDR